MERFEATNLVHDAIRSAGACVTDFHKYSNFSVCLNVEIEAQELPGMYDAVLLPGLRIAPERNVFLGPYDEILKADPGKSLIGTVAIAFLHTEPDLKIETPAVPG